MFAELCNSKGQNIIQAGRVRELKGMRSPWGQGRSSFLRIEELFKLLGLVGAEQFVVRKAIAERILVIGNRVAGILFQAEGRRTRCLSLPGGFATMPTNPDTLISSMKFREQLGPASAFPVRAKFRAACAAARTVRLDRQVLGAVRCGRGEAG